MRLLTNTVSTNLHFQLCVCRTCLDHNQAFQELVRNKLATFTAGQIQTLQRTRHGNRVQVTGRGTLKSTDANAMRIGNFNLLMSRELLEIQFTFVESALDSTVRELILVEDHLTASFLKRLIQLMERSKSAEVRFFVVLFVVLTTLQGHGDWFDNQCLCYQNSTHGYWESMDVSVTWTELTWTTNDVAVPTEIVRETKSCSKCVDGYGPETGREACTSIVA